MGQSDLVEPRGQTAEICPPVLRVAFLLLVPLSLLPRLVDYDASLLGPHFFRQTQTAITIWSLLEHTFSPFNYQTPLFGPPWQVPFEFPIFQITAAGLVALGVSNIDVAARFTNLLYFYLSASILYLLTRRFLNSSNVARFVLLVYVWCPFNVMWSRTCMIDFASVSFALAYLYGFDSWLRGANGRIGWRLGSVILLGVLGYLSKSTTMAAVLLPTAYLSLKTLFPSPFQDSFTTLIRRVAQNRGRVLLAIGAAVLLPALCGAGWLYYADGIKEASPFTSFLVSSNLVGAFSGPWENRLDLENWAVIFSRVRTEVLPHFSIFLVPIGMLAAYRQAARGVDFVHTMLFSALITVSLFFHAYYVHDYYLMAITANLSVAAGVGAHYIFVVLARERPWLSASLIPILFLSYSSGLMEVGRRFEDKRKACAYVLRVGEAVRRITEPHQYVVVKDFTWNSGILYYARRRGLMLWPPHRETEKAYRLLKEHPFTTVVYKDHSARLLSNWRHHKEVVRVGDWRISKVWDGEAAWDDRSSASSMDDWFPEGLRSIAEGETRFVIDIAKWGSPRRADEVIKIPTEAGDFVVVGWAVDEAARDAAGGVYLEIDGHLYETKFPIAREDVAQHFGVPAYKASGFELGVHTMELGKGRHELSIKILANDGKAHYAPDTRVILDIE